MTAQPALQQLSSQQPLPTNGADENAHQSLKLLRVIETIRAWMSSTRRRNSSSFIRAFFFVSEIHCGILLPPETLYTCASHTRGRDSVEPAAQPQLQQEGNQCMRGRALTFTPFGADTLSAIAPLCRYYSTLGVGPAAREWLCGTRLLVALPVYGGPFQAPLEQQRSSGAVLISSGEGVSRKDKGGKNEFFTCDSSRP